MSEEKVDMIWEIVQRMDDKLDEINGGVKETKLKQAVAENEMRHMRKDFDDHKNDRATHYNPYHSETLPQKLKRKKGELTVMGVLVTIAVGFLTWLAEQLFGFFS